MNNATYDKNNTFNKLREDAKYITIIEEDKSIKENVLDHMKGILAESADQTTVVFDTLTLTWGIWDNVYFEEPVFKQGESDPIMHALVDAIHFGPTTNLDAVRDRFQSYVDYIESAIEIPK